MTGPHAVSPIEHARLLLLDPMVCPACGGRLVGPRCATCRLDLGGPAGVRVWEASRAAADALARRAHVVAEVRAAQQPTSAPPAPHLPPHQALPPAPAPWIAPEPGPGPTSATPARPRQSWRVQTVLVTLGASLLALASLVFLVFTWDLLTLAARAAVIALGTAAVLGIAVVLRRRGLAQSAEAVAALGAALLALDVWAVWATGVSGGLPGWVVGGLGMLVSGAVLAGLGVRTGLRTGTVAAAALVGCAPLPAVVAAVEPWGTVAGLLAVLVLTSVRHAARARDLRAERLLLGALALTAAAVATPTIVVATAVARLDAPGDLVALLPLALLTTLVVGAQALRARPPAAQAWAAGAAVLGVLVTGAAVPPLPGSWSEVCGLGPVLLATAAAELLARPHTPRGGRRRCAAWAGVATAATLASVEVCALLGTLLLSVATPAWDDTASVPASLTTTAVLAASCLLLARRLARTLRHVAAALASLLVLTVAIQVPGGVVVHVGALCAVALGTLLVPLRAPWRTHTRVLSLVSAAAAVTAAGTVDDPVAGRDVVQVVGLVVATVVTAASGRWATTSRGAAHRFLGPVAATVLGAATLTIVGGLVGLPGPSATAVGTATVAVVAVALVLHLGTSRRLTRGERLAVPPTAAAVLALAWLGRLSDEVSGVVDTAGSTVLATIVPPVVGALLLTALAVLGRPRHRHGVGLPLVLRAVAASLVVPAAAATTVALHVSADLPTSTACLVATALACGGVLVARALPAFRTWLETSGAAVAALAFVIAATSTSSGTVSLVLVLDAAAAGVVALAPDRRPLRWWALGLAVLASWTGFGARDVGTPEAYTAPLGLVLVAVAARRLRRAPATPWPTGAVGPLSAAAGLLLAGALLVGIPPAVVDDPATIASVHLDRTVLLTAGVVLVAAGAVLLSRKAVGQETALVLAGVATVLGVLGPVRRCLAALADAAAPAAETWGGAAALVLALATLTVATAARSARTLVVTGLWATLAVVALPSLVVAAARLADGAATGLARTGAVGVLGTAVALVGIARGLRVLVAPGLTLLAAATAVSLAGPVPTDAVLAVAGALAGCVGAVELARRPGVRSLRVLGGPCALVLLPAVVGLQVDPAPWRWGVTVGGAVLALVVGAARRLQGPFVVGAGVLVAEIVLQLVAAAASVGSHVGWWPLLFVGGGVLTLVGVTYERRLRDAREATRYVARMR